MKRFIYTSFLIGLLFSCDVLDEKVESKIAAEAYYTTIDEVTSAVVPIYYHLMDCCDRTTRYNGICLGANDVTTSSANTALVEFEAYNISGSNTYVAYWWENYYKVIIASNNVIVNSGKVDDSDEKDYALGQAYFARAWVYFWLVRVHNRIPLYTDIEIHTDISLSEPELVYEQIISDLKMAEELLPDIWPTDDYRSGIAFTSGAAKSVLSLVYLTMAGYPVKDSSKYALAAAKAKEVIDNAGTYGYKLLENCSDLWANERFNDETVMGIYYNNQNGEANQASPLCGAPSEYSGWDSYFAEINFFNKFPEGARKDATFWTSFPILNSDGSVTTKPWGEMKMSHPYYRKMIECDDWDWEKPWVYVGWTSSRTTVTMRYAEVLLIYAEAKAMSSSADESAYAAIDEVRERAGLPGFDSRAFK